MKITLTAKVKGGKISNPSKIKEAIQSFEGKEIQISIQKKKRQRSSQQNAYYWGLLLPLTTEAVKTEWGEIWSNEKAHEFYKSMFLFNEKQKEGKTVKVPKSTSENSTLQQEDYHLQIRGFLLEWFNVSAPLPNEQILIN